MDGHELSDRNTLILSRFNLYLFAVSEVCTVGGSKAVTTSARGFLKYGKYADDIATKADDAAETLLKTSDDVNLPGGNGAPQATGGAARVGKVRAPLAAGIPRQGHCPPCWSRRHIVGKQDRKDDL